MLQTISWKDFSVFMAVVTVLYYGWWLRRYYPAWSKRKPGPPEGKTAEKGPFAEPATTATPNAANPAAGPYPTLQGTTIQENVDASINRALEKHGSIHPDPGVEKEGKRTEG